MSSEDVPLEAVVFDLDGTLVDTLADVASAMNHTLATHALPQHRPDDYRRFIGEGVERLVERALPAAELDLARKDAVVAEFRAYYAEHLLDQSTPYPGVPELLAALTRRRVPMCVLSNKPDPATRRIIAALFPAAGFAAVVGQRPGKPRKPDPSGALELAELMRVAPARCAFVGDTGIDMATARAAGMRAVGVGWGFREPAELRAHGAERLIDHPAQLLDALAGPG